MNAQKIKLHDHHYGSPLCNPQMFPAAAAAGLSFHPGLVSSLPQQHGGAVSWLHEECSGRPEQRPRLRRAHTARATAHDENQALQRVIMEDYGRRSNFLSLHGENHGCHQMIMEGDQVVFMEGDQVVA